MKTISPLEYQSHPNWEQIKAYCVAVVLGIDVIYENGSVWLDPNVYYNKEMVEFCMAIPESEIMMKLMEKLYITPTPKLGHHGWDAGILGFANDSWMNPSTWHKGDTLIQAVILCTLAVYGKVDVPSELIDNRP